MRRADQSLIGSGLINLLCQAMESTSCYVFGELLDHRNVKAFEKSHIQDERRCYRLLTVFTYGTYSDYLADQSELPRLTPLMTRKIRLLTLATMATKHKILKYDELQEALKITNVRDLEDLIIDGTYSNVVQGKLDQRSGHFEVDYTMARDIKKSEIKTIVQTLDNWCKDCDEMINCLDTQAERANKVKSDNIAHKAMIEKEVGDIRGQIKNQQASSDMQEDPDSRMDLDPRSGPDRRDKKGPKAKGQRGSAKGGFWQK